MKVFDAYAKYYDLLYNDKNYDEEVKYVDKFIKKYRPHAKRILDLGCGTGKHDFIMANYGYDVTGVELSKKMLKISNNELLAKYIHLKNVKFIHGDIRKFNHRLKFDVIISLFHVMSYQTSNKDLKLALNSIKNNLKPGGKFMFDFWYGPGVLTNRPESRYKKFENKEYLIERFADATMRVNENIVDVKYRISIREKCSGSINEINEIHSMRYLFLSELNYLFESLNMRIEHSEEWLTGRQLNDKSWYGFIIGTKK